MAQGNRAAEWACPNLPWASRALWGWTAIGGDMLVVVVVPAFDPPDFAQSFASVPAMSKAVTRIWIVPGVPGLNRTPDFVPAGQRHFLPQDSEPTGRT